MGFVRSECRLILLVFSVCYKNFTWKDADVDRCPMSTSNYSINNITNEQLKAAKRNHNIRLKSSGSRRVLQRRIRPPHQPLLMSLWHDGGWVMLTRRQQWLHLRPDKSSPNKDGYLRWQQGNLCECAEWVGALQGNNWLGETQREHIPSRLLVLHILIGHLSLARR